ncbi:MAG: sugar phosphate nucleotidyltransferase, partial [Candidatus Eisenbacteria bacterium]|nr:sugar phosphate nucleotidyltransferase [Candidatus Eisenbacteria bacterium]
EMCIRDRHPVDRFLVHEGMSIRDALQRIEETERRTVFIVDGDRRLRGVVTDGDIRRWLLGGGEITVELGRVANPNPVHVAAGFDREDLRERMIELGATCIPLVDREGRVTDLVLWEDVFVDPDSRPQRPRIEAPVVIMAGGRGLRMAPFTQVLPKPLLPVGDKTVIEVIIERFLEYGVREFLVTTNYKSGLLKAFFQELPRAYEVRFVEEETPLGTAGSLGLMRDRLDATFIVTNCDIVMNLDYHDLPQQHAHQENLITMVVSLKNYSIPYGVCEIENGGRLKSMREKPEFHFLVNTGMYALSPAALGHLPAGRTYHMTDLIEAVRSSGGRVGVYPIGEGAWPVSYTHLR